jgi:hypothetical protein
MLRYSTALLFLHAVLAAAVYTAVDDSNRDAAVKEWFDPDNVGGNPDPDNTGGNTYGPIAGWDVQAVTDWTDFLAQSATPALTRSPHPRPAPPHHALSARWIQAVGPGDIDTQYESYGSYDENNGPGQSTSVKAFNEDLSAWSTPSAVEMHSMFNRARAFGAFDNGGQPLALDTASVTSMESMFFLATAFNQPLVFDTGSVISMASMFSANDASVFNQPLAFDTSSVTNMGGMFEGAT